MEKNKLSLITLSIASILSSFHINASENIIIDNNKKTDLAVEIKNGIEHINIEKANKNGISHNYYQRFNVSEKGVVIQNPTYLTNSAAKFIINEVTSNEKSLLNGKLRVQGDNAYLMVANPNGIECNGCSFSGTKQQLLVTGKIKLINNEESTTLPQGSTIQYKNGDLKINPSAGGKIVFRNSVKPVHDRGVLTLITNETVMSDGDIEGKVLKPIIGNNEIKFSPKHNNNYYYVKYNFSIKQESPANYSLIRKGKNGNMDLYRVAAYPNYVHSVTGHLGQLKNSPYAGLVIKEKASVKFDGLSITQTGDGRVINKGQLHAKRFYANVDNEIINERGAKLIIGDDSDYKPKNLFNSEIKAKRLIFDSAYLNINKANISFNLDSFGNYDGIVKINDSTINLNSKVFVNTDYIADIENKDKINGGKLYFDNSTIDLQSERLFFNNGLISGSGYLKIKSFADLKNSGTIEVKHHIKKNHGMNILKNQEIIEIDAINVNNDNGKIISVGDLTIDTVSLSAINGSISTTQLRKKALIKTANIAPIDEMSFAGIKNAEFGQSDKL
ncbi:filamentous hemagglutinin N-terminal domain-containing protein [Arsenophonus apicola]|uniref:Filamentous hemagglutinin N-terminal domain-containing protein n=1 Tax=Arsenophonus apicola TaxID=2879119 RepID=A0ABY8P1T6_9GAMM|nr:filamentous hemagglutinin N-terminal domain-containing protein [Arsenophonus apicola]WGO83468.1 filamentous hemagglutinin N-terminal domain-containing protein [Arsenophonus apicola]